MIFQPAMTSLPRNNSDHAPSTISATRERLVALLFSRLAHIAGKFCLDLNLVGRHEETRVMRMEVKYHTWVEELECFLHATRPPIRLIPKGFSGGRQGWGGSLVELV
jgi:hypothetical protein